MTAYSLLPHYVHAYTPHLGEGSKKGEGGGPRKGREGAQERGGRPKKGGMRGMVLIKLQMINAVHLLFIIIIIIIIFIIKESKITQPVEMDMKIIPEQHTH